ncbi:hypothetical protein CC80DRAFT_413890 [Byssothecium circinans]|uniref:Zn(2)-C6 fungal-type domain-containing protein n=1 Tax=Byssothecium circinans TaxID=147558 RepID=A0A6A5TUZ9_9PLEO|nr:hypothetical protein CC80DRAFT_413890 [Byssothecium circinans]
MVTSQPQSEKLHTACDECRTRKLKCSGHHPACIRCEREKIQCSYSPQKPMGRPRKRQRNDSSEQAEQLSQATTTPVTDAFDTAVFNDIVSPPPFDDLPGFDNGAFSGLLPPSYVETTMSNSLGQDATQNMNFNPNAINPSIDPSLWNARPIDPNATLSVHVDTEVTMPSQQPSSETTATCSCFSLMFLAVSELQSITDFSFPTIIPRLRSATHTASIIIHCPKCPLQAFTAVQNVQSLTHLLFSLAERYHKVLSEIEAEAARIEVAGKKKPFRVGDNSPENMHLHTGTLDCPMGFNIELEPRDWRRMCKAALKTEVLGGGGNKMPLVKLLDDFEKRQRTWHMDKSMQTDERTKIFGTHNDCKGRGEMAMCLRMVHQVRKMIDTLKWED